MILGASLASEIEICKLLQSRMLVLENLKREKLEIKQCGASSDWC